MLPKVMDQVLTKVGQPVKIEMEKRRDGVERQGWQGVIESIQE